METVRAHRPPRAVFSEPEAVADTNTRSWYNHETLGELALSRNTSVSLGDHFSDFIDAQVRGGRYGSASDVVRAGLRLLEEHEAKVKALQDALVAGEESGPPRPFDNDAFLKRMRERQVG